MVRSSLGGVFPVLPTVFTERGDIDADGMRSVVEYVVASGADGLVFPGLASEYDMLSFEERRDAIGLIGAAVAGRVRFVVGASSDDLEESARLAAAGTAAGASAAMVMTPRAIGPDVEALSHFYRALGVQAGLPIMLQNAPAPMGLGLSANAVSGIVAGSENVAWVKEENMPCGQRISALLASGVPHLEGVFGGAGGRYITDELARGAVGTMPAAETPEVHVALMRAHRAGDRVRVWRLYEALLPILMIQAVYRWRLTKEVLRRRGIIASAHTRAPGPEFDEVDKCGLAIVLERLERAYSAA